MSTTSPPPGWTRSRGPRTSCGEGVWPRPVRCCWSSTCEAFAARPHRAEDASYHGERARVRAGRHLDGGWIRTVPGAGPPVCRRRAERGAAGAGPVRGGRAGRRGSPRAGAGRGGWIAVKPSERRERLAAARLYVVTGVRPDLAKFLHAILGAGVDVVQLREKEAEADDLLRWGETFREAAERHGALFIVNDRPDVAFALDADGVHLGQNDLPPRVARELIGEDAIIGLSTHSPEQWDAAAPEADYLCIGPVWETPTKPGRPAAGIDAVRHAAASAETRPWFAIGGITQAKLPEVLDAGATRIVVVRAVTASVDPAAAARVLVDRLASGARS